MSLLALSDVSLIFPSRTQAVLKHINYEVSEEDFIIILGSNGSGKSTLLKLVHQDYRPTSGDIRFLNKSLNDYPPRSLSSKIVMLNQHCSESLYHSLTLYENYLLAKPSEKFEFLFQANAREAFANYLQDFNPALSSKLDARVCDLSGGEQQALALSLCLLTQPTLLLLDEHTSALDPKTSDNIMNLTKRIATERKITCILTTHDLNIAKHYGNRILFLKNGGIHRTIDQEEKLGLSVKEISEVY